MHFVEIFLSPFNILSCTNAAQCKYPFDGPDGLTISSLKLFGFLEAKIAPPEAKKNHNPRCLLFTKGKRYEVI